MLRFVEDAVEDNKKFAKLVYDFFWDEEKQELDFYHRRRDMIKKIEGWPKGLDLENFGVNSVRANSIVFVAGGDWQDMANVTLCKHFSRNELVFKPFEGNSVIAAKDIKKNLQKLISLATGGESFEEALEFIRGIKYPQKWLCSSTLK